MIVRELTSGIYFGERGRNKADKSAYDTMYYNEEEIERILRSGLKFLYQEIKRFVLLIKLIY